MAPSSPGKWRRPVDTDLLALVTEVLDHVGIDYMGTGSVASALHGQPRATRDIDVVIDPDLSSVQLLVELFPPDRFYVSDAVSAVERRDMFNIVDTESGWKVDLIVRKDRPFSESEFRRRLPATMAGIDLFVTTPEDAILSKLEWQLISARKKLNWIPL